MAKLDRPIAVVCFAAVVDLVARSEAETRRTQELVARTPGGVPAHRGTAVPLRFALQLTPTGGRLIDRKTGPEPAPLLIVAGKGPIVGVSSAINPDDAEGVPKSVYIAEKDMRVALRHLHQVAKAAG